MPDSGGDALKGAEPFRPVYAERGRLRAAEDLVAVGAVGLAIWELDREVMIPLPDGADLFSMPGRSPLALDPGSGAVVAIEGRSGRAECLSAVLPVGYTRLLTPAAEDNGAGPDLPLYGYTALAQRQGKLYVAARRTDDPRPWHPRRYDQREIERLIEERRREYPANRVLAHLINCARAYHCRTAQNLFYRSGEAGLPAAPSCNAACLGCISSQPAECCPAPQSRISFVPDASELAELAASHLELGSEPIVSFGQGCEGEPLTVWPVLAEAIRLIRLRTRRGVINLNTNAGDVPALAALIDAGLEAVRVSIFSAVAGDYDAYHRPAGFGLEQVRASLSLAVRAGLQTSLNLLTYPGFTDSRAQAKALVTLCRETGVRRIQIRNLNLDPRSIRPFLRDQDPPGLPWLLDYLRHELPGLVLGNYSRFAMARPRNET